MTHRRKNGAFTLFEVLIAIFIIAILSVLLLPGYAKLRARAQRVQCAANLRSLSVAAEQYVQQNGMWPQIPLTGQDDAAAQDFAQAWLAALKPFGVVEKTWICPTMQNSLGNPDYLEPANARIDYMPMQFDDKPTTPHQWPRQPWFIESGDVHGHGNLIIFTDGSISDLKTVLASPTPARR